ncbi:MAG: PP2C family protein-serine/threonine phosphatase [Acidobacteriota bacterium]|jgi:serine phosphatase RsbU (regulator of sigma subunit)
MTPDPIADLAALAEKSRERFEGFAAKLGPKPKRPQRPALTEDYWASLRQLFTRDVTPEGLRSLLQRETQDTFRFLTREVDLSDLSGLPAHKRHSRALWRFFLAVSYRLSPWRRVLFAASVLFLVVSWLGFLLHMLDIGPFSLQPVFATQTWLLAAATALFFVLVLELRDKLGLKGDLEVARQIQFGLLPFDPFERDGISIVSTMRPANTVGGDYFDIIDLGEGKIAIALGDVAGKAMPAALLMALLQGSLRTLLSADYRGETLIAKLNTHLCANIPSNRLITLFYAELETSTGSLRYVNAGHNPPFVLGGPPPTARLGATGMALGVLPEAAYEAMSLELQPGDRLLMYTDGVTEAANPADEEYGDVRLEAYIRNRSREPGRQLIDGIVDDVLRFCGTARPHDDMTLMCLGREA